MFATKLTLLPAILLALAVPMARAADQTADRLKATPQENLWADLASADEATAARALLMLAKNPQDTLAYLKTNLPPVKADPKRVAQLIADLDSNQFATRQKAGEELEYLGKYIKNDLEKALASAQGIETKQRIQQLVDRLPKDIKDPKPAQAAGQAGQNVQIIQANGRRRIIINGVDIDGAPMGPATPIGPSMYWVRAVRAVALLEHIGTPEAKQLLDTLAAGEAEALPTQQAKAALDRLSKR
jgi:hypothetical protein